MNEHVSPSRLRPTLLILALIAVLLVGVVAWAASRSAESQPPGPAAAATVSAHSIVPPVRSAEHRAEQTEPTRVPTLLARARPLTVVIETRETKHGKTRAQRKTVTRGGQSVHVAIENGAEWLFVRNSVDPRRVSATLVDHHRKTLIEYSESELRASGLAAGWADVVGLGVPPESLENAKWSDRRKEAFGLEFTEALPAGGSIRSLWWSHPAAIPLRVSLSTESGSTEIVVRSASENVEEALLGDIRERYPTYMTMDVADFREAHHEHSEHAQGQH